MGSRQASRPAPEHPSRHTVTRCSAPSSPPARRDDPTPVNTVGNRSPATAQPVAFSDSAPLPTLRITPRRVGSGWTRSTIRCANPSHDTSPSAATNPSLPRQRESSARVVKGFRGRPVLLHARAQSAVDGWVPPHTDL